ncbi:MAG: LysR substrate-binding domain-containing protein [Pseudomonadota bacterium]
MHFDPKSLELFVRVASLGAIGKAGAELGFSRTAATQRIQDLEQTVGVQLLHRTTRSVSLSVDGEAFLGHARRILQDMEDALSEFQSDPASVSGELRIASSASFGRKHLAPHITEFLSLYPKVSVQLHLSDSAFDIVENGYDLAIRLGELAPSMLKAHRIGDSARIVVASPKYLQLHGAPTTLNDLRDHNCLIRSDVRTWKKRGSDGRIEDFKVTGNFDTNLAEAITEAALSGLGIARKCKWEVSEYLAAGELVEILSDYTVLPEWGIYAVRSPSRSQPPRARAFTEFIMKKFQDVEAIRLPGG